MILMHPHEFTYGVSRSYIVKQRLIHSSSPPQGKDGAPGSQGLPGADGRPVSCPVSSLFKLNAAYAWYFFLFLVFSTCIWGAGGEKVVKEIYQLQT